MRGIISNVWQLLKVGGVIGATGLGENPQVICLQDALQGLQLQPPRVLHISQLPAGLNVPLRGGDKTEEHWMLASSATEGGQYRRK